jgi:hypothetical protein
MMIIRRRERREREERAKGIKSNYY